MDSDTADGAGEQRASHRRALVTGGARRIGAAIAADLAAHGYDVAIHANRSADPARALARRLSEAHGVTCAVLLGDLAVEADTMRLVPEAMEALGGLDVVVNNASIFEADEAATVTAASWDRHMRINAHAPARLTADLARLGEGPRLAVNLIDQRVLRPNPNYFSYSASKAALHFLTRTMAQAFAPEVRVVGLGPGPVIKSANQSDAEFAELVATMPLTHAPSLEDFGRSVRFLHATPSITGQMLALDAGQHLAWQTPDTFINE